MGLEFESCGERPNEDAGPNLRPSKKRRPRSSKRKESERERLHDSGKKRVAVNEK